MVFSKIIGVGSSLPAECVSNTQLAHQLAQKGVDTSDEWITTRTGIKQRYLAPEDIRTSDLAAQAAQQALAFAQLQPNDIDLLIVATTTPDFTFPSTACVVQSKLGIDQCAAFDVQAVCSGFVYALATADHFISSGNAQRALVIGAETFSRLLDWNDRSTCVLFGDGAGAVILQASSEPGIVATQLDAKGQLHSILNVTSSIQNGQLCGHPFVRMEGQAVFRQAVTHLEQSARQVCDKAHITVDQVDRFIPHQANIRIIQALGKKLGLRDDQVVITVDQHANTSAASVPLALDVAVRNGQVQPGHLVLLQGVGGGFTWGSILVRM